MHFAVEGAERVVVMEYKGDAQVNVSYYTLVNFNVWVSAVNLGGFVLEWEIFHLPPERAFTCDIHWGAHNSHPRSSSIHSFTTETIHITYPPLHTLRPYPLHTLIPYPLHTPKTIHITCSPSQKKFSSDTFVYSGKLNPLWAMSSTLQLALGGKKQERFNSTKQPLTIEGVRWTQMDIIAALHAKGAPITLEDSRGDTASDRACRRLENPFLEGAMLLG